jgi:hypothetical protein
VPLGVYRVAVCVAGQWHDLMHDLVVARDGTYLGGKKLATDKPTTEAAPDAGDPDDTPEDEDGDGLDAPEPLHRTFHQSTPEGSAYE